MRYENGLAIEGPAWLFNYVRSNWVDQQKREQFLSLIRRIETEPTLLGASAHLMTIARKDYSNLQSN